MKTFKLILSLFISLFILFILTNMNQEFLASYQSTLEPTEEIKNHQRILVVAPHCDDEILGPGGAIYNSLQKGDKVRVVMMTNGDGFSTAADINFPLVFSKNKRYLDLGQLRQIETIRGLGVLGVSKDDIIFLGYPDGGLDKLWSLHWDKRNPYLNPNNLFDYSPYSRIYHSKTLYTGENVVEDLQNIIKQYKPTEIYYPHPNDVHPDHWATNCFIKYVLTTQKLTNVQENLYLVHRGSWPMNLALGKNQELVPPIALVDMGTEWRKIPLTPKVTQQKQKAILQYHTQVKVMEPFLLAFIRSNELFGSYPNLILPNDKSTLLIPDPVLDFMQNHDLLGADIIEVSGGIIGNNLELTLQTNAPLITKVNYLTHLRLLGQNGEINRIDISFQKNKTSLLAISSKSITKIADLKVQTQNNELSISFPLSALPSFEYLYINVESMKNNTLIDKTAWKMLKTGDKNVSPKAY